MTFLNKLVKKGCSANRAESVFRNFLFPYLEPFLVSAPSLDGSEGRDIGADGHLDTFLAAASFRVVRDAVQHRVQAPAPASVVPSVSARGVDAGVLGVLHAGGASRVVAECLHQVSLHVFSVHQLRIWC